MRKEYLEINQKSYDILAEEYKYREKNPGKNESKPWESGEKILELLKIDCTNEIRVLEVGPGVGKILDFFQGYGCQTVGVELSGKMARIAKESSPMSLIINQDINSINFLEKQFHIVYLGAVLHLFPIEDASILLQNIWRWLSDEGILYLNTSISHKSCDGYFEKKDYHTTCKRYRKYWLEDEFSSFVQKHKFSICHRGYSTEPERNKHWVALYCKKV